MITSSYPEHDRLRECAELRVALNEFAAWLSDHSVHLVRYDDAGKDRPVTVIDGLIAKFLGVDEVKLEVERQAMVADLRELAQSA